VNNSLVLDTDDSPARGWALISATLAPVVLIAGWLVAGLVQSNDYNPVSQTISVLAGSAANHRWIMTFGLVLVGVCHLVTAAGLTSFRMRARLGLGIGGLAGLGVAIFAEPVHGSTSTHIVFATLCVLILALWPATIPTPGGAHPAVLTTRTAAMVTAVFLGLALWVYIAGHGGGALGIAERVDTAIANAWPLVVLVALRRHRRSDVGERAVGRAARIPDALPVDAL
jgi:hypothetical membrane protein